MNEMFETLNGIADGAFIVDDQQKLQVHSRLEAVIFVLKYKLLD